MQRNLLQQHNKKKNDWKNKSNIQLGLSSKEKVCWFFGVLLTRVVDS